MSNINPYNIDGTFPIAGQDNSSQGFRDNFTNTQNNFITAKAEITDLQTKSVLTTALTGGTVNNDFLGNVSTALKNAVLVAPREVATTITSPSTSNVTLNFGNASYYYFETASSVNIGGVSNWPTVGTYAKLRLAANITNTAATLTFPAANTTIGASAVTGWNSGTITFTSTGTYVYELASADGGATVSIQELTGGADVIRGNVNVTGTGTFSGNVTAPNFIGNIISTSNAISVSGNVTAGNIIANTGIYGNVLTAIQSSITQVGTLTSLTVSGNVTAGNAQVTGTFTRSGALADGYQYITPANASSTQLNSNICSAIVNPSGTIASATLIMPASPVDGQRISVAFGNTITALTMSPSGGQTLNSALTAGNTSAFGTWIYRSALTTWYRIG